MKLYLTMMPVLLIGYLFCPKPNLFETEESFGRLEITLHFEFQEERGSNQFAVWIQDQNGNVVKTLFVTAYAGHGGFMNQLDCLPMWVNRASPRTIPVDELDAITGATPSSGWYTYTWDGKDTNGRQMPLGNYVFKVEGNQHWDTTILFSGLIRAGRSEMTVKAQWEQNSQDHDVAGSDMLMDVTATYYPSK